MGLGSPFCLHSLQMGHLPQVTAVGRGKPRPLQPILYGNTNSTQAALLAAPEYFGVHLQVGVKQLPMHESF